MERGISQKNRQPLVRLQRNDPYRLSDDEMVIEDCTSSEDGDTIKDRLHPSIASSSVSQTITPHASHTDPVPTFIK